MLVPMRDCLSGKLLGVQKIALIDKRMDEKMVPGMRANAMPDWNARATERGLLRVRHRSERRCRTEPFAAPAAPWCTSRRQPSWRGREIHPGRHCFRGQRRQPDGRTPRHGKPGLPYAMSDEFGQDANDLHPGRGDGGGEESNGGAHEVGSNGATDESQGAQSPRTRGEPREQTALSMENAERRRWKGSKKEAGCSVGGFRARREWIVRTQPVLICSSRQCKAESLKSPCSDGPAPTGRVFAKVNASPMEGFAFRSGSHQRARVYLFRRHC